MNKTMLIGRLTNAPEISKTTNNKSYVRVTLAVNRRFKNEKGEREADLWGKSAETFVSYAKKGSLISVEGEIRTRNYTDKNEQKHCITEILGLSYDLLESRATLALRESAVNFEELLLEADELPF